MYLTFEEGKGGGGALEEKIMLDKLFKAHSNGRNMLRPFAWSHNNVGTCCVYIV